MQTDNCTKVSENHETIQTMHYTITDIYRFTAS